MEIKLIVGIGGAFLSALIGCWSGVLMAHRMWEEDSVKAGKAEFYLEGREVKWRWKEEPDAN